MKTGVLMTPNWRHRTAPPLTTEPGFVVVPTLSSLVVPYVVFMTVYGAASNDKFGIMAALDFSVVIAMESFDLGPFY